MAKFQHIDLATFFFRSHFIKLSIVEKTCNEDLVYPNLIGNYWGTGILPNSCKPLHPVIVIMYKSIITGKGTDVPLYELEQEVCRIAKNLTSWQFLTIRLSPTIIHEAFPKTVKKSPRPLKRPLRIIKKLLRTITTCKSSIRCHPETVKTLLRIINIFLFIQINK